jgi:hypothetical protein
MHGRGELEVVTSESCCPLSFRVANWEKGPADSQGGMAYSGRSPPGIEPSTCQS